MAITIAISNTCKSKKKITIFLITCIKFKSAEKRNQKAQNKRFINVNFVTVSTKIMGSSMMKVS